MMYPKPFLSAIPLLLTLAAFGLKDDFISAPMKLRKLILTRIE